MVRKIVFKKEFLKLTKIKIWGWAQFVPIVSKKTASRKTCLNFDVKFYEAHSIDVNYHFSPSHRVADESRCEKIVHLSIRSMSRSNFSLLHTSWSAKALCHSAKWMKIRRSNMRRVRGGVKFSIEIYFHHFNNLRSSIIML